MPKNLQGIRLDITTQEYASIGVLLGSPMFHVFVRNRRSDTTLSAPPRDFVTNKVAYDEVQKPPWPFDINPYLGAKLGVQIPALNSSLSIDIVLRDQPILPGEAVLPVVDIHLYTPNLVWSFDYTITFYFSDGDPVTYAPKGEGVTPIALDPVARDYSGICQELYTLPPRTKTSTEPVYLASVKLDFETHDKAKPNTTAVNVHIANRLSAVSSQDIAIGLDVFPGQAFSQDDDSSVVFGGEGSNLPLSSDSIQLADMVLPVVYITIDPATNHQWIFDYRVTFAFSNGQEFSSSTSNVILDYDCRKHMGAYNGSPFPVFPPPGASSVQPVTETYDKKISLSFVQEKLQELVNGRPDPLFKFRLHNIGNFGGIQPVSYLDVQTIEADPLPPGTPTGPDYVEPVRWGSSPMSLGWLDDQVVFDDVQNSSFSIDVQPSDTLPIQISLTVVFEPGFNLTYAWGGFHDTVTVSEFQIELRLSLDFDASNQRIDAMGWLYSSGHLDNEIPDAIRCSFHANSAFDGIMQHTVRQKIFNKLKEKEPITGKHLADKINERLTGWLLGGVAGGPPNGCTVKGMHMDPDGDTLHITYARPSIRLPEPAGWPAGVDFTPGQLVNIDHIIVLTKENRSFDTMLGYLSLPVSAGGQGRTDVDGLKGDEFNKLGDQSFPSFAFPPQDTVFSPNAPQDFQRTLREIDNGRMDGFVEAFADENGLRVASRVMGYHNATNVPEFDALSRDFAICHRWFAPHPGPTFPNRFYEMSGRLNISPDGLWCTDNSIPIRELGYSNPLLPSLSTTIFDALPETVTWRFFEHGYCTLRLFADHTFDSKHIISFDDPEWGFLAVARRGELPNVTFIDPHFIDFPPGANCDEPPSDVRKGQEFVRKVVEAVVSSPQWDKTLLIITYDEHGGFFDHVRPPAAVKNTKESLETYGPRVPTFVISPWVKGGTVFGHDGVEAPPPGPVENPHPSPVAPLYFDHTSILKTIARKFLSNDPPFLGARYAAAHDLSEVLAASPRSSQFRPFIRYNLVYTRSQKGLEVQHGSLAADALLWQNAPTTADGPQQFRFEDAGDGYWYLRTHTGNLYMTADPTMKIIQDVKYPADGSGGNAGSQRWKFTSGIMAGSGFTVTNAAYPGKTLQPLGNSTDSGAQVVLGDPEPGLGTHVKNAWQITSTALGAAPGSKPADNTAGILWHNSDTSETQIWFMHDNRVASRGTVLGEDGNPLLIGLPWTIVAAGDFSGDGMADILWHNSQSNETQIWFMYDNHVVRRAAVLDEQGAPLLVGPPWRIVAAGDFNGNGMADILWHNSDTNEIQIWFMHNERVVARPTIVYREQPDESVLAVPPWNIAAAGDFNGDGMADILVYNSDTYKIEIWHMNENLMLDGLSVLDETGNPILIGPPWRIAAAGNFDTYGGCDILWHNDDTQESQIWFTNGIRITSRGTVLDETGNPFLIGPPWTIAAAAFFGP